MSTAADLATNAAYIVMIALSLLLCLLGAAAAVLLSMLAVSALADVWDMAAELATKRGRRRARLLWRLRERPRQRNRSHKAPHEAEEAPAGRAIEGA